MDDKSYLYAKKALLIDSLLKEFSSFCDENTIVIDSFDVSKNMDKAIEFIARHNLITLINKTNELNINNVLCLLRCTNVTDELLNVYMSVIQDNKELIDNEFINRVIEKFQNSSVGHIRKRGEKQKSLY